MSDPSATAPEPIRPWDEPAFGPPARAGELGTLGRYRVLEKLGQGGMGAVYLGFHEPLNRKVALKVMLPQYAAQPVARERFLREARAAAMVKSDHVVTIHDVDEAGGVPFIAMEHLLGTPLDQFLKTRGELPLPHALRVCREVALGLAAAHDLGLIHRDVKPGNIWLEAPKGRVKLLDFGLARGPADEQLTGEGAVMGTPAYMSPEQGRGKRVDHRSDLFSLGTLLYRLCTGKLPFTGDGAMAILTSLAVDTPNPPRDLNPDLPDAVAAIITKLLAKNPDDRYQTAREVAAALAGAAADPLPKVVAVPVPQMAVGAQTQNVWEDIADSGSVAVPLAAPADATLTDATEPTRTIPRPAARWPLALAAVAVLAAVGAVAAVALWPKKTPEVAQTDPPPMAPAKHAVPPPPRKSNPTNDPKVEPKVDVSVEYPLPPDHIGPQAPLRPKEVFSLDYLDPAKHIPVEERFSWQPKELVTVLGSHRQRAPGVVRDVSFSPDGATVLANGHAFDAAAGRALDWPALACSSPDGKRAANGNKVWEVADLKKPPVEYPGVGNIRAFLAPDVVLADGDGGFVAWRLDPKEPKPVEKFAGGRVFALSANHKFLTVGGVDQSCWVYDAMAGGAKPRYAVPAVEGKQVVAVGVSDTGILAVCNRSPDAVQVWDISGAKPQFRHTIKIAEVNGVALSSDGGTFVSWAGNVPYTFDWWSLRDGEPRKTATSPDMSRLGPITGIALHPDGGTAVTGHADGAVRFWGIEKGVVFERHPPGPQPRMNASTTDLSPDGRSALLYHDDRRVHLWNLADLTARPVTGLTDGGRDWSRFDPAGATAYIPGPRGVRAVSVAAAGDTAVEFANGGDIRAVSPDGKWVVVAAGNELVTWDVSGPRPRELPLRVGYLPLQFWRFTPDGRFLLAAAAGGGNDGVRVWAMTPRGPVLRQELRLQPLTGGNPPLHIALSPDGATLVSCNTNGGLSYFDLKEGVLSFRRKTGDNYYWAEFSPDGTALLAQINGTFCVCSAATGAMLHPFALRGPPTAGRWHPDGCHVLVTNFDGTTYVLRVPKAVLEKAEPAKK